MKKLCIVPFTVQEIPMLRYLEDIYQIEALISPKGVGLEGEDISILRNEPPTGYKFVNSVEDGINRSDVVIIPKIKKDSLRTYTWQALMLAVQFGKEILCFMDLSDAEKESVLQQCKNGNSVCRFLDKPEDIIVEHNDVLLLNRFDVPVFYVSEAIPDCDSYDVFLKLADWFRKTGKSVLAVSEDNYNQLFDYYFVKFGARLEVKDQILRINQMIYDIASNLNPDVILIRLPEPMMKYNDSNLFDCGSIAYLISQAIPADGCIFCTQVQSFSGEAWEEFSDLINSKFGCPIIGVHVSNRLIDATSEDLMTIHVPMDQVCSEVEKLNRNCNITFYQFHKKSAFDTFSEQLENEYFNLPYGVI